MNRSLLFVCMMLFLINGFAQEFISSHTVGNEPKSYSKILVVAKVKNDLKRIEMEDDLVKRLKKKGLDAVPSYPRLTNEMIKREGKDEKALEVFVSKLRENDFDGILVTSFVDSKQTAEFNPGRYRTSRVPVRYGRFGRYYGRTRVGVYRPGSVEKSRDFVFESLLYDLRGSSKENSLHWMGKIRVTDPTSFDKTTDKYAKIVVKKLSKEAIE